MHVCSFEFCGPRAFCLKLPCMSPRPMYYIGLQYMTLDVKNASLNSITVEKGTFDVKKHNSLLKQSFTSKKKSEGAMFRNWCENHCPCHARSLTGSLCDLSRAIYPHYACRGLPFEYPFDLYSFLAYRQKRLIYCLYLPYHHQILFHDLS